MVASSPLGAERDLLPGHHRRGVRRAPTQRRMLPVPGFPPGVVTLLVGTKAINNP